MKINKTQFQKALAVVKPGLLNKEILAQTTSFAFLNGRVATYNDEISISHPIKEIDFEGAINGQELYELLARITKDEVDIVSSDSELLITAGRVKAGLRLEKDIKLPLMALPKKMEKIPNPEQFCHLVKLAMETCSTDLSKIKLTCVCVKKSGEIIGSDGYRLLYGISEESPVADFLLPATSAEEVIRLDPTHVSLEKAWVHFKNADGTFISCRRLEDDYIENTLIQNVLKISKGQKIQFPSKIEEMLDRVWQFAKRDFTLEEKVEVNIVGGKISLKASTETTRSWIEEKSSITCDADFSFIITPSLFGDILKMTHSATINNDIKKMKFQGEGWQYVLMLKEKTEDK